MDIYKLLLAFNTEMGLRFRLRRGWGRSGDQYTTRETSFRHYEGRPVAANLGCGCLLCSERNGTRIPEGSRRLDSGAGSLASRGGTYNGRCQKTGRHCLDQLLKLASKRLKRPVSTLHGRMVVSDHVSAHNAYRRATPGTQGKRPPPSTPGWYPMFLAMTQLCYTKNHHDGT